jgi:hypothetical protein
MVASAGTANWSGASRQAPSAARTGWGASAAPGRSRVGDGGEGAQQVRAVGVLELARVGVGEAGQGGWGRG